MILANNASAGTGSAYDWPGGVGTFSVVASTWGGGDVQLQYSPDGGSTWIDAGADADLTSDAGVNFSLGRVKIRVVITTASGVDAWASPGANIVTGQA